MIPSRIPGLWRIRRWYAVAILACTAFALFFLLKGEDSTFFVEWYNPQAREIQTAGESHVSAFTYYFVWPQSRRDDERKREEAFSNIQLLERAYGARDPAVLTPETFRDKMAGNISKAAILGSIAILLAIMNLILNFRRKDSSPKSANPASPPNNPEAMP